MKSPLREPARRPRRFLIAACACLLLLAACAPAQPSPAPPAATATVAASPTPAPTAAAPAAAGSVRAALLAPEDLTHGEAYPAAGWRRCDDYTVDRNLERIRSVYPVAGSAAAIWEYATVCGGANPSARVDEYAWRMQDLQAAATLVLAMLTDSYIEARAAQAGQPVNETVRGAVVVRTLADDSSGTMQHVAEILGQEGSNVAYLRVLSAEAWTDDAYAALARLCLDRLAAP